MKVLVFCEVYSKVQYGRESIIVFTPFIMRINRLQFIIVISYYSPHDLVRITINDFIEMVEQNT